jgi:hypothetical protein
VWFAGNFHRRKSEHGRQTNKQIKRDEKEHIYIRRCLLSEKVNSSLRE